MKKRVNISIGEQLHERAVAHADSLEMDLSELVSDLLRKALRISVEVAGDAEPVGIVDHKSSILPVDLPARGRPCPCGSGIKFKRCTCAKWASARKSSVA